MKLRGKILTVCVASSAVTAAIVVVLVLWTSAGLRQQLAENVKKEARKQCATIATDVRLMAHVHNETIKKEVLIDLNVARDVMHDAGGVTFSEETVDWRAVNQFTKQTKQLALPKMMVGSQWLGQHNDPKRHAPMVDDVKALVGGTCTVFQRMNEAGDMLRIATNVEKLDNTRAIGTYIPAQNADGTPNKVVATVLRGETYVGRAYVVNAWYNTAYEPIRDPRGRVVGVLYVGVKQQDVPELRKGIMDLAVGKTGYVYVLGGSGDQQGQYIISHQGKRDGENIYDARDADGNLFIHEVVAKAKSAGERQCEFVRYPWQNSGEDHSRMKIAAVTYFEPWDWVIGVGAYEDDFADSVRATNTAIHHLVLWIGLGAAVAFVGCGAFAVFLSGRITRPLRRLSTGLNEMAQGEWDLTRRFEAHGRDEVAQTARGVNTVLEKLQQILQNVTDNTSTLSGSSVELSSAATEVACETEQMSEQSSSVAAAAEELTTNMANMAASTEEMSTSAKTVAAAVEQMTASISEVARNAEQASGVADNAATLAHGSDETIRQLGGAADEIGKVIETIQDIAEQTNLLALNATIEAARAGEAGKGFAVVATEVKELAKQTAAATEDIRQRIEGIQQCTSQAVEAIGNISEAIGNVNDVSRTIASAVEEQSITTREIAANVAQSSSAAETVAQSVSESATVSRDIAQSIAHVDAAVKQTARGAEFSQDASGHLMTVTEQLQSMVGQFKTDDNRFHAGPIKAAHGKWRIKLSEMVAGRRTLDMSELTDHTQCAFGKWYRGEGIEQFGDMTIFREIDDKHQQVHALARQIVETFNAGQKQAAAEQLADFRELTETMFQMLDQLEEEANREPATAGA